MDSELFDIVIIGGGPAGYVAAIRATQLGLKTAIVERDQMGGVCLNWGCIPTKILLRCADAYRMVKQADLFGVKVAGSQPDLPSMIKKSRTLCEQLRKGLSSLIKKNGITVFHGNGRLLGGGKVSVSPIEQDKGANKKQILGAKNIILATGARSKELPNIPVDGLFVWSYKEAMLCEKLPESLLIIGSGALGMEFATFYSTLGTKVTVIEISPSILHCEDEEIAEIAHKNFVDQGIEILVNTSVSSLTIKNNRVEAKLTQNGQTPLTRTFDRVLSAVGVTPNTADLGLENTNVKLSSHGFVNINDFMETDEQGIFAIGDITTAPLLAHKASRQGMICVEKIVNPNNTSTLDPLSIPACIYSHPQIASIGYTEKTAKSAGFDVKVGRFTGLGNGTLTAIGETNASLIKTIFDNKTGEFLGAHMIGPDVSELIYSLSIVKHMEGMAEDLIKAICPHPTLAEMVQESVLDSCHRRIH